MNNANDLLRGNTPTLILAALIEGPQHGYAIAQEIKKRTGDSLKFKQGTLYPVLHTLERDGLVTGEWLHNSGERPRLVYAITEAGKTELSRRVSAWKAFAEAMNTMIGGVQMGEAHEQPS